MGTSTLVCACSLVLLYDLNLSNRAVTLRLFDRGVTLDSTRRPLSGKFAKGIAAFSEVPELAKSPWLSAAGAGFRRLFGWQLLFRYWLPSCTPHVRTTKLKQLEAVAMGQA